MSVTRARSSSRSRRRLSARLDALETRTLLSAISYYNVDSLSGFGSPTGSASAADAQGNLWVANFSDLNGFPSVEKLTKTVSNGTTSISDQSFELPLSLAPTSLTYIASRNTIMVASSFSSEVVELDANGNLVNDYDIAQLSNVGEGISFATATPDGALWFTSTPTFNGTNPVSFQVGRIAPDGTPTTTTVLSNGTPNAISAVSSNTLWFGGSATYTTLSNPQSTLNKVSWDGTNVTVNSYTIPGNPAELLGGITTAADGSVWYSLVNDTNPTDHFTPINDQIDHATLSNGTLTLNAEYDLPKVSGEGSVDATFLQFDASGTLWFAEQQDIGNFGAITSFDPSTGDFTRSKFSDSEAEANSLTITGTDVYATLVQNDFNTPLSSQIADLDLSSGGAIFATDPAISAIAGQAATGVLCQFASADAGDFSYTINYGNGQISNGTVTNDGSGVFSISGNVTYALAGNYPLSISIVSATGDVATVHGLAIVTSVTPLTAQGVPALSGQKDIALTPNVVGQSTVVVAQFSGAPASYTATINWGDNTTSTGAIVSLGNNQYAVELPAGKTKTYTAVGNFTITTTISNGTQTVTASTSANIVAVPVVASQNLLLKPLLGPIFVGTVATFTADPTSNASWFKVTINWGDGTSSKGIVVRTAAGAYEVLGVHIYKKGTYSLNTVIVDTPDNETATATATIKV